MKYTIEGFSQKKALELGLSSEDLVLLRWFVDFFNSGKMIKLEYQGKTYAWVNYKSLVEQMPIISCNKRTLARKFQRLVNAEVLTNETIKQDGTYSAYGFGRNYENLISTTVAESCTTVAQKCATPLHKVVQPPCTEMCNQNTNLQKKTNLQEKTNRDKGETKRFTPPTIAEVQTYANERKSNIDCARFFDYYESKGWMVGKNKMKDWKAAFRNWERNESNFGNKTREEAPKVDEHGRPYFKPSRQNLGNEPVPDFKPSRRR